MESITITGLNDLQRDLKALADKYPDKTESLLKKSARKLRKNVAENFESKIKNNTVDKKPLIKNTSYKVGPVQGYGAGQSVDILAQSPHFHLLEHGHNKLNRKRENIGYTPGYHSMEEEVSKLDLEKEAEKMLKALLKESRLC